MRKDPSSTWVPSQWDPRRTLYREDSACSFPRLVWTDPFLSLHEIAIWWEKQEKKATNHIIGKNRREQQEMFIYQHEKVPWPHTRLFNPKLVKLVLFRYLATWYWPPFNSHVWLRLQHGTTLIGSPLLLSSRMAFHSQRIQRRLFDISIKTHMAFREGKNPMLFQKRMRIWQE